MHPSHAAGVAVAVLLLAAVGGAAAALAVPGLRARLPKLLGALAGGLLAVYLVIRGIAEFWVVDFSNPASYRGDWGGPSLAGVLAVHTGPAVIVVAGSIFYLRRRRRRTAGQQAGGAAGSWAHRQVSQ